VIGVLVVAGQDVASRLEAEKLANVPRSPRGFASDPLCALHVDQARRGFLGASLVKSFYGWSVRYDSGLQEWALIASSRAGQLDGSFAAAVRYARRWQAEDPERRYVTAPESARDEFEAIGVTS
jgi:hypothetical protein